MVSKVKAYFAHGLKTRLNTMKRKFMRPPMFDKVDRILGFYFVS